MTGKHGNKKHDRAKRGVKLFFFGKPHGQKHKPKKNKYYVSHENWSADEEGSIMSGDSPLHNNRTADAFDFSSSHQEGRPQLLESKPLVSSEPVATTSKDAAIQSNPEKSAKGEVQASVLVEPGGKDEDDKDLGSPTLNNSEHNGDSGEKDDEGRRRAKDDDGGGFEGKDKKDKFRKNGNIDRLDGVWVPKENKKNEDQEDDNCIVKCLYVTMTCCECSIM